MEHTEQCQRDVERYKEHEATWLKTWPNYCQKCRGWGAFTWSENQAPLGSGRYWPMEMAEPCQDCTEKGICARCGKQGLDIETGEGPCVLCSWNYDDGLWEPPECTCWMDFDKDEDYHVQVLIDTLA